MNFVLEFQYLRNLSKLVFPNSEVSQIRKPKFIFVPQLLNSATVLNGYCFCFLDITLG